EVDIQVLHSVGYTSARGGGAGKEPGDLCLTEAGIRAAGSRRAHTEERACRDGARGPGISAIGHRNIEVALDGVETLAAEVEVDRKRAVKGTRRRGTVHVGRARRANEHVVARARGGHHLRRHADDIVEALVRVVVLSAGTAFAGAARDGHWSDPAAPRQYAVAAEIRVR